LIPSAVFADRVNVGDGLVRLLPIKRPTEKVFGEIANGIVRTSSDTARAKRI
jgi:hypothetical protein